jgi:hypothetical protein
MNWIVFLYVSEWIRAATKFVIDLRGLATELTLTLIVIYGLYAAFRRVTRKRS